MSCQRVASEITLWEGESVMLCVVTDAPPLMGALNLAPS